MSVPLPPTIAADNLDPEHIKTVRMMQRRLNIRVNVTFLV